MIKALAAAVGAAQVLADIAREGIMSDKPKTPTEIREEAADEYAKSYGGRDYLPSDFLDGYDKGHTEGRREVLEMAQGLVDALKEAKAWLDTPIGNAKSDDQSAYETIVEALAKFEAWGEGK